MKILLVDDNPISLRMLQRSLGQLGYGDVQTTTDAREGLAMVRCAAPDAILSDMCMPGMSGLELVQALRAEGFGMPVFILSATVEASLQRQLRTLGCPLVPKPIQPDALKCLLEHARTQGGLRSVG